MSRIVDVRQQSNSAKCVEFDSWRSISPANHMIAISPSRIILISHLAYHAPRLRWRPSVRLNTAQEPLLIPWFFLKFSLLLGLALATLEMILWEFEDPDSIYPAGLASNLLSRQFKLYLSSSCLMTTKWRFLFTGEPWICLSPFASSILF